MVALGKCFSKLPGLPKNISRRAWRAFCGATCAFEESVRVTVNAKKRNRVFTAGTSLKDLLIMTKAGNHH
jgi:hypothetical protein